MAKFMLQVILTQSKNSSCTLTRFIPPLLIDVAFNYRKRSQIFLLTQCGFDPRSLSAMAFTILNMRDCLIHYTTTPHPSTNWQFVIVTNNKLSFFLFYFLKKENYFLACCVSINLLKIDYCRNGLC